MKNGINVDNSKSTKELGNALLEIMAIWGEESDQVKLEIISALESASSAPLTISGCSFYAGKRYD